MVGDQASTHATVPARMQAKRMRGQVHGENQSDTGHQTTRLVYLHL